jgi:subtilisin family serine protease/tetratricopeptide (TPR) repeat protein
MSIAYVIHSNDDLEFVQNTLLRPLPSRGFQRWISSASLSDPISPSKVMRACDVILAVVSQSTSDSTSFGEEISEARLIPVPTIVVLANMINDKQRASFPKEVWLLPLVDLCEPDPASWHELTALLPLADHESPEVIHFAKPIEWNEEIFSGALKNAVSVHDHNRAETLVTNFTRYIEQRPYPYQPEHANRDLKVLRDYREFKLMTRYGEAVLASGTHDEKVRRQYAQALIEQKQFDHALEVLNSIVEDPASDPGEVAEAYGLMGRTYKQQYLDNPQSPEYHELMRKCMHSYRIVYEKDQSYLWHGVNLASCIVRAAHDGVPGVRLEEAEKIAASLLERIDSLERNKKIDIWDYATRVEALLVLRRYDEAAVALDRYLSHPEMHAFEVSSTYRQFKQLLLLDQDPNGKRILDQLWEAVQRYRGVSLGYDDLPAVTEAADGSGPQRAPMSIKPLLIRITDPDWNPKGITDLVTESHLGTIVSAHGSDDSIKELLSDPNVISVNDSSPAGTHDCDVSVPFIRVADNYPGIGGVSYTEKGGGALIAIIDNGIDVLHQAFLDANGKSRIVGIWDQTDSSGTPPTGFTFGTYHDAAAIAGYIQNQTTPAKLGRNKNGGGHGTHVASIAAGRKVGAFAGGVAPEAKILVVIADGQSPIGYSKSHVDALNFIDKIATQLNLPVVVNVSQGMNAGAHDGRSMLEVAFDAFSEGGRKAGRVIVKSAGNERNNGGHAKVTLLPSAIEVLRWIRDPQALVAERIELWWNSGDEFEFKLGNPTGQWSKPVSTTNQKDAGIFSDGTAYNMEFTRRHVDNGDSLLRIKIGEGLSAVTAGTWQLEILSKSVPEGGDIHAWIERGAGKATSFDNFKDEEMTLSVPGTANSVITVGAVKPAMPTQVGTFSSYGPTRDQRKKPEVAAPGIGVRAAQSGTASDVVSMDGTSMAAPHVTGAIALLLSHIAELGQQPLPTASQISAALRQKTINYSSRWDRGQGFGILDVAAFLAAF